MFEVDYCSYVGWKVEWDDGSMSVHYADTLSQLLLVLESEIFHFNIDDIIEIKKGFDL